MKDFLNFVNLCTQLPLSNVIEYFEHIGWIEIDRNNSQNIRTFIKYYNNEIKQIDLPKMKLCDYSRIVYNAILSLCEYENRHNIHDIYLEILNPNCDIIKLRIINDDSINGTILVDNALSFFENSRKLIISSALDYYNGKDRPILSKGKLPKKVQEISDSLKFGQTEIGSYIIKIICPLSKSNEAVKQLSLFDDDQEVGYSLTRNAINYMINSIHSIEEKMKENSLDHLLDTESDEKVSLNFLEALSNLEAKTLNTSVEINIKWAQSVFNNRNEINNILLSNDIFNSVKRLVDKYKNKIDEKFVSYDGKVSSNSAECDIEKRTIGTIKLKYISQEGKIKTISFDLFKTEYELALEAHKQGKTVRVTGEKLNNNKLINCSIEIL